MTRDPLATVDVVLTVREVATIFGVDPATVSRWDDQGYLRAAFKTPGGHRRYYRADIDAFIRQQRDHPVGAA